MSQSHQSNSSPSLPPTISASQQRVFDEAFAMGEAFFAGDYAGLAIHPRLFPLFVGPTGAGKTFLCQQLARRLSARYLRYTYGDWLPQGAREGAGTQTTFAILEAVEENQRLVLHIDELDKCREDNASAWSRSVSNDIWNTLDGLLPVREYIKASKRPSPPTRAERLANWVRTNLWIVGSGTWQDVFAQADKPTLGFSVGEPKRVNDLDLSATVRLARSIPDELLARFSSDLLILRYPETIEEKQHLLDTSGIAALARKLGISIDAAAIDFRGVGLRKLESMASQLLIEYRRRNRGSEERPKPTISVRCEPSPAPAPAPLDPQSQVVVLPAPDRFDTAACLVRGASLVAPRAIRLRQHRGKNPQGWSQSLLPDPAFLGFEQWCREQSLPPFPAPDLSACVPWLTEADPFAARPITTAEEFFHTVLHNSARNNQRLQVHHAYQADVMSRLADPAREELEQFDNYLVKRALTLGMPCGSVLNGAEVVRQLRFHVNAGASTADHWLRQHASDGARTDEAYRQAMMPRLHSLWGWAIDQIDHLAEWDGVVEMTFRIGAFDKIVEKLQLPSGSAPAWAALSAVDRLRVETVFHNECPGMTQP